jgi:Peptidase family M20/M25/M40
VKREGDILRAPGVGDDTSNLMATLEMFRALNRGGVKTKGDLVFVASVQEELGLIGAKHWLETSGYKPDMFVAVDVSSREVWYGALRITQFKFFYTSPGAHTMESRGAPSPAKAVAKSITALYEVPLPPIAAGLDSFKLPVLNVGMLGGGTVVNAIPRDSGPPGKRGGCYRAWDRGKGGRRFPSGAQDVRRLLQGTASRGTVPSFAGTNGPGRQQLLPQTGHTRNFRAGRRLYGRK